MKLEELRRELKEDRAKAEFCPRCGGYGILLGKDAGPFRLASHCDPCDVVFGWERDSIPIPPPSNQIELNDVITALDNNGQVVTGQVFEVTVGRDIRSRTLPDGAINFMDRGPLNTRARLRFYKVGTHVPYEVDVDLRGAFIVEKSATHPPTAT